MMRPALICLALFVLAGCQSSKDQSSGIGPPPSEKTRVPTKPPVAPSDAPHVPTTTETQEKQLTITPPLSDGWKPMTSTASIKSSTPTKTTPPNPAEAVAKAVDEALANLKHASALTELISDDAQLKGSVRSEWEILQAGRDFSVGFYTPAQRTKIQRYIGQEGRRIYAHDPTEKFDAARLDSATIEAGFVDNFPQYLCRTIAGGGPTLGPLVETLQAKQATFHTEETSLDVGGRPVKFTRLLIDQAKPRRSQWEIRIQAERNLPVTIKVITSDEKGRPRNIQLNIKWSFTKPIDPSHFQVPKNVEP